jgi:hypothetical protein
MVITGWGENRGTWLWPKGGVSWDPGEEEHLGQGQPQLPPALKHELLGDFPGKLASSEMAIACGLLVDRLLQIQIPACSAEVKVI